MAKGKIPPQFLKTGPPAPPKVVKNSKKVPTTLEKVVERQMAKGKRSGMPPID